MGLDASTQALVAGVVLLLALVIPVFILFRMSKTGEEADANQPAKQMPRVRDRDDKEGKKRKGKRAGALDKMKQNQERAADEDEDEKPERELTAREARKEEKRAEKEEAARQREAMREAQQEREETKQAARRKKEEEYEARQASKEEEARRLKEEEEKKKQEEYDKWKDMFTVDDEGTDDVELEQEDQGLLQTFVSYVKARKVVVLEELAAAFDLRVQDAISRVQALESMGWAQHLRGVLGAACALNPPPAPGLPPPCRYLTGVVDDRGKFIYVSNEEMDTIAAFVKKKGRISIAALAQESNKLVDLNVKLVETDELENDVDVDVDVGAEKASAE